MFAKLPGLSAQNVDLSRVRKFTGDGTEFLKLPGLKKIEGVRVGNIDLPQTETFTYPAAGHKDRFIDTTMPVFDVQADEEGTPILLRADFSNDGKWQKDVDIYITGDWEEPAQAEEEAATT